VFTIDDLILIMKRVGGAADDVDLNGDVADVALADLGFDSLAILEIQSQIEVQHQMSLPDNAIVTTSTPREAAVAIAALRTGA
jgi:act minimal PKS acyl carrier protein